MIWIVVGWISLVLAIVLARRAIERHNEWLRIARAAVRKESSAERLKRRPVYQTAHEVGRVHAQLAVEIAAEIPDLLRPYYLQCARNELKDEKADELELHEDVAAAVRKKRSQR